MRKFVYIDQGSIGPELAGVKAGDICEFDREIHGNVYQLKRQDGESFHCPRPYVRELDDTPIAAGDDVVCVDAKGVADRLTTGKQYAVIEDDGRYYRIRDDQTVGLWAKSRFVKVKPQPAPEVKQEAAEPKPAEDPDPNFDYQPSPPPTKREPGTCLTRVGREFWMVKGFGPTQYEHDSLDSAIIEAERLARANPGVPFTVLGPVSIFFNGVARIDRNFDDGMPF